MFATKRNAIKLLVMAFVLANTLTSHATLVLAGESPEIINVKPSVEELYIEEEITRLSHSEQHWILIDLSEQHLIAWEGDQPYHAVTVSTGKAATPTPTGIFAIQSKHKFARMQGADYDIPNVPFTMYYDRGYGIHGAYWHNNFGTPVSHGCTNVAVDHAEVLFNWASVGTPVVVRQ